jgi:hypothetical protein
MPGVTLIYVDYTTNTQTVRLQMQPGTLLQSAFSRILIEDATPGVFQSFTSASATFSDLGATVQWTWTAATLWTAADNGEEKRVIVEF